MAKEFLSGGEQTTINSTITELFPALAFMNRKVINRPEDMYSYITGLGDSKALDCLLYTSPSPRDSALSRMPSAA